MSLWTASNVPTARTSAAPLVFATTARVPSEEQSAPMPLRNAKLAAWLPEASSQRMSLRGFAAITLDESRVNATRSAAPSFRTVVM